MADGLATPVYRKDDTLSLSRKSTIAMREAEIRARQVGHRAIGTEDVLWALFHGLEQSDSLAQKFLKSRGVSQTTLYANHTYSKNAQAILQLAAERATTRQDALIGTEDLLIAMFASSQETSRSRSIDRLFKRGVTKELVFGEAELSFNVQKAMTAAINEAHRLGHARVGTEDLLWALFQKTDRDSRARHWLGSQGILNFDVAMPQSRNLVVQRNESPLKALTVGGLAGTVETLMLQPLVYLKTFQQVQRSVALEPLSLRTMYRGMFVNAASIAPISAVQYTGNMFLDSMYRETIGPMTNLSSLGIAGLSGALSAVIVTPVELTMISQQRFGGSVVETIKKMKKSKGWTGLQRGFSTTMLRETGWTFGFLGVAPVLKKSLQEDSKFFRRNEVAASAAASVVGGQVAALVTQPLDTIKTIMQTDRGIVYPMKNRRSFDTLSYFVREEGVMSLWRGISARSLRLVMAVFILGETQQILSQQFESVGFL